MRRVPWVRPIAVEPGSAQEGALRDVVAAISFAAPLWAIGATWDHRRSTFSSQLTMRARKRIAKPLQMKNEYGLDTHQSVFTTQRSVKETEAENRALNWKGDSLWIS